MWFEIKLKDFGDEVRVWEQGGRLTEEDEDEDGARQSPGCWRPDPEAQTEVLIRREDERHQTLSKQRRGHATAPPEVAEQTGERKEEPGKWKETSGWVEQQLLVGSQQEGKQKDGRAQETKKHRETDNKQQGRRNRGEDRCPDSPSSLQRVLCVCSKHILNFPITVSNVHPPLYHIGQRCWFCVLSCIRVLHRAESSSSRDWNVYLNPTFRPWVKQQSKEKQVFVFITTCSNRNSSSTYWGSLIILQQKGVWLMVCSHRGIQSGKHRPRDITYCPSTGQ